MKAISQGFNSNNLFAVLAILTLMGFVVYTPLIVGIFVIIALIGLMAYEAVIPRRGPRKGPLSLSELKELWTKKSKKEVKKTFLKPIV